jgi:hypothetical protein
MNINLLLLFVLIMKLFDQKFSVAIHLAPVYGADMQCVRFQNSDMAIKLFF